MLPSTCSSTLLLNGFNCEERAWWEANASCIAERSPVDVPYGGVFLLGRGAKIPEALLWDLRWVCALGTGRQVTDFLASLPRSFISIREYGLLPSACPRLVVPLGQPDDVVNGLSLHRPGRLAARLGVMAARTLARAGCYKLLRRKVLIIATRGDGKFSQGAAARQLERFYSEQTAEFALYLGTPDGNRKTVVLPLSRQGPQVIFKVGQSPRARGSLEREATALRILEATDVGRQIPRLVGVDDDGSRLTLVQQYRKRMPAANRELRSAVADFLVSLASIGRQRSRVGDILETLKLKDLTVDRNSDASGGSVPRKLFALADGGSSLWLHTAHGDLAPWNCAWTTNGLFVFDWEEYDVAAPAFGDAFYFMLAPRICSRWDSWSSVALRRALRYAEVIRRRAGLRDEVDIEVYFALWLLPRLKKSPAYRNLLSTLNQIW